MIDWLLNDILGGWGRKRADVLTVGTWVGFKRALKTYLFKQAFY